MKNLNIYFRDKIEKMIRSPLYGIEIEKDIYSNIKNNIWMDVSEVTRRGWLPYRTNTKSKIKSYDKYRL